MWHSIAGCVMLVLLFCKASEVTAQQTYVYATRDTFQLKLDVYHPAQPRTDSACVVYVFGGGFYNGARNDKESVETCRTLANHGYVAVSIDYRLGLRVLDRDTLSLFNLSSPFQRSITWAVEDCCAAVAYLYEHASELGINTTRMVLTGSSAGAITVLQTDYARANGLSYAVALPASWKPCAVVSYSGGLYLKNRTLRYASAPAPTCFFHGTADRIVNYRSFRSSLRYSLKGASKVVREFRKNDYTYAILRFDGRGHEVCHFLPATIEEFSAFVDMAIDGRTMHYDATCSDGSLSEFPVTDMSIFKLYAQ